MIIEFKVQNFRSIRDEQSISFVAAEKLSQLGDTLIQPDPDPGFKLLRSLVFWGANASGKSTVLSAISAFADSLAHSSERAKGRLEAYDPFLFDQECRTSSTQMEVLLLLEGQLVRYGFAVGRDRVEQEWLFVRPIRKGAKESRAFQRVGQDFQFGPEGRAYRNMAPHIRPNLLAVGVASSLNVDPLEVAAFFTERVHLAELAEHVGFGMARLAEWIEEDRVRYAVEAALRTADFGISSLTMKDREAFLVDEVTVAKEDGSDSTQTAVMKMTKRLKKEMTLVHKSGDGEVPLPLWAESAGTLRFLPLIGFLTKMFSQPGLLLLDEFDASLHPELTQVLLKLINDPDVNPHGTQVILTTHEVGLMEGVVRHDQIWFTEKNGYGVTEVFSLMDLPAAERRDDNSIVRKYRAGRYGAVPTFTDLKGALLQATEK
jgi:predicted ATPase